MAYKPKRPCSKAGCPNLTTERYCAEHAYIAAEQERNRYKHYDQYQRDAKTRKFYNSKEWKLLRQQALIRDKGLCLDCLEQKEITMATEVDHIIPIKVRWDLRLKLSNLRSRCDRHHRIKTAEDKRRYGI